MIIGVQARVHHDHRNTVIEERVVVGVGLEGPRELQIQAGSVVFAAQQPPPTRAGARAEDGDVVVAKPADHVQVEGGHHVVQGNRGVRGPMLRAQQALLFGVPEGKQNRSFRRAGQPRKGLGKLQDGGCPAGIVVGAGVNGPRGIKAQAASAVADVIVMRPHHDYLIAQAGIASRKDRQHIAEVRRKRLKESIVDAGRLDVKVGQLRDEIVAGGMTPARARHTAFHGIVGQPTRVLAEVLGRDRV